MAVTNLRDWCIAGWSLLARSNFSWSSVGHGSLDGGGGHIGTTMGSMSLSESRCDHGGNSEESGETHVDDRVAMKR